MATEHRRSYLSVLWRLVRNELEPYPGRLTKVIHYTVATAIVAILVLTFRLPSAVLGAYYPLLIMEDTPAASLRAAKTCVLFLFFTALWLLCGCVFVLGAPELHFLWVAATLFLAVWLMDAAENRAAATSFGLYAAQGIGVLDLRVPPEVRFETILYILLNLLIGVTTFISVQYVLAIDKETNGVQRGLHTRLSVIRNCLEVLAEGRDPSSELRHQIRRYSMVGTGRIRQTLLGLHYSRRAYDEQASAIALIGNMVNFTFSLVETPDPPVPNQRARLHDLANAIDQLREDFLAGRVPQLRSLPSPQPAELRRSPVYRLEYSVAILTQIFSSHLIAQQLPEEKQRPKGLIRPGAASNPEILQFAMRGALAAICCYIFYWAADWPGLSVALTTCIVTALSSTGASRQKQVLRFVGATAGGILAFVSQIFILSRVQSIGGFTLALAAVVLCATWVSTSSPRIGYAGGQMALSYEMVHLSDPHYNLGLTQVRDRIFGIFLGLIAMWLIFDRLWSRPAAPAMIRLFDENLQLIAKLPLTGSMEVSANVTRTRDAVDSNFETIRNLADAVLLEFRRDRERDLLARQRIRSWLPLVRIIFMLRMAIMRRGLMGETGVDDHRVEDAVTASSYLLEEIRGMAIADRSKLPDQAFASRTVAIPLAKPGDPSVVRIAISLATVSAYLREDVLLDLTT